MMKIVINDGTIDTCPGKMEMETQNMFTSSLSDWEFESRAFSAHKAYFGPLQL
jgi:hypothetical protein